MKWMMKAADSPESGNRYVYFRAVFPADAELAIYATDFYELWNNGRLLAYGPAKSGEPLLYFDRFRLSGSENHVAVKVHGRKRPPELWCECPGTPVSWRAKCSTAYDAESPYTIGEAGFTEYYDLDRGEEDWLLPEFDDRGWLPPVAGRTICEDHLLPRPIPYQAERKRKPLRIVRRDSEILADFGEMVYGRLELGGVKRAGSELRIDYIEDLAHGWAQAENRRAMYSDKLSGQTSAFHWKSFGKRGFRYLALNSVSEAEITVWEYGYPVRGAGSFRSSDPRLNRLWDISERTLRLCMDDIFNDCPHRDQAQWMDAFVSSKAALSVFGVTDLTRKSILQHAVCSFVDGKLLSPSICGWSFMPDYAMVQILFIRWYLRVSGDTQLLAGLWNNCVHGVAYMDHYRQSDGLLADVSGAYLDNAFELCRLGKSAAMNSLYYAALEAMADLAGILGKTAEADSYRNEAAQIAEAFHAIFDLPGGGGTLRDSSARPERGYFNYNFSCEFGGKYQGKIARAEFTVCEPADRTVTLFSGAFGPYRVFCNGEPVVTDSRAADWSRPLPAYAPAETGIRLQKGVNRIVFEADCNFLNWDLFFAAEGVAWGEGELAEFDPATGKILTGPLRRAPRPWTPPHLSQATHGYAAYAGLIGREALRATLRDEYPRNYVSVRVPLFSTETADPEKLKDWVLPPNTPWTMFYFLSGLFENGLEDDALSLLRRAWGVMLDRNAENTWEEWNCNSSLCHAWGASPCWFLHREILGVRHEFLSRGEVPVRPNLFDLDYAHGRVMLGSDEWIDIKLRREGKQTRVRLLPHTARSVRLDCSRLPSPLPEILREMDEVIFPTCR